VTYRVAGHNYHIAVLYNYLGIERRITSMGYVISDSTKALTTEVRSYVAISITFTCNVLVFV